MKILFAFLLMHQCLFGQTSTTVVNTSTTAVSTSTNGVTRELEKQIDVGKPKLAGSMQFDQATQVYTIRGAGYNVWFNRDEFSFVPIKIYGDFILTTNLRFTDTTGNVHKKAGWMVRESLDESAEIGRASCRERV